MSLSWGFLSYKPSINHKSNLHVFIHFFLLIINSYYSLDNGIVVVFILVDVMITVGE